MKIKHGFYASVAAIALSCAGFLSSCEDKCASCNCDSFHVDYVVSPDSSDVHLSELSSKTTVVIVGSGLGSANGVYLVDKDGYPYSVELNPSFVTENSIVVTLNSDANELRTESLLVTSTGGCQASLALPKPVPAPSIKMMRSEFVEIGDTLRIAGSSFFSVGDDKMEVYFVSEDNNDKIKVDYLTAHDDNELLIPITTELPNNLRVYVKNQFGECTSSMLFRDTRNVFLDFDTKLASADHGIFDSLSTNLSKKIVEGADYEKHLEILNLLGGTYPKGCSGYYAAIGSTVDGWVFSGDQMIYLTQYEQGYTTPVDLRGQFKDQNLNDLVLKFEVYVSSKVPLGCWFYIVFSAYGSEVSKDMAEEAYDIPINYGHYSRDLTNVAGFDEATLTCSGVGNGAPAAWLNMGTFSVDDGESASIALKTPFHTDDKWMTVAVPLTRDYFKYNVSQYNLPTTENFICCETLKDKDFYNFFIHCNAEGKQAEIIKSNKLFCGFDNFRIVPDDNGGVRFTKYYGATPASKYPF